eukprot:GFUD01003915.1.p1 GENE.GFUD01003915.1~~GFUD01003915.1.p1  ORF type:complete len:987 (+),score=184.76 GFUD01003915.1:133-3093(+)
MLSASSNKLRRNPGGEDGMPLVSVEGGLVQQTGSMCRTASCVDNPQKSALEALQHGDLTQLSDLLAEDGAVDPNAEYSEENFSTLLNVALEIGNNEALKLLLKGGAKPDHINSVRKVTAIHLAASKGDLGALKHFTGFVPKRSLDIRDNFGRTALHRACTGCSKKNADEFLQCVTVLVSAGCSINLPDNKGGQTPLYIAANTGHYDCVKFLIDAGADPSIPCQGTSTKLVIREKFNKDQVDKLNLDFVRDFTQTTAQNLFDLLDIAEQDGPNDVKWRTIIGNAKLFDLNTDNGMKTIAQLCAERGLHTYLKILLEFGADPNSATVHEPRSPLLLASSSGHSRVLQVLADHNLSHQNNNSVKKVNMMAAENDTKETVLHQILRKPKYDIRIGSKKDLVDYETCLDIVLNPTLGNMADIVNRQDILGNTALHYAVQFWDQETVTRLLLLGANIGIRNNLDEAPISHILPETMEDFLNVHCLKSEGNPTNENFRITYKYDFLAPEKESKSVSSSVDYTLNIKASEEGKKTPTPETDVLWYMARSKDHRHLLKHPVITSFLSLKWSRISGKYNANILFFFLFVIALTFYIFSNYGGLSLGVTMPSCPANESNQAIEKDIFENTLARVLWWFVTVLLGLLVVREILQFSINPSKYFSSIENTIEVILIIITAVLLFYGSPGCYLQMKRELSAAALLLSWIDLVTMIGRHPMLSDYNTYLTMFYRVLKTFLLFLTWYSFFIIAFGLGFYILLHKDNGIEQEYPYFDHLDLTLLKTFSMFVGELEFSNIPLDSHFSRVFFLSFVFLIVVVLMNLLNGLAVSDTGLIREQAEIHAHICRVEAIAALEATLLGDPSLLSKGPAWLQCLIPSCGLRKRIGSALRIKSLFGKLVGSSGILLFYSQLPDKKLVVYPNRRTMVCTACFSDKEIGRGILNSTKTLILKLTAKERSQRSVESHMEEMKSKQKLLEENQTKLDKKLDNIISSLENISKAITN